MRNQSGLLHVAAASAIALVAVLAPGHAKANTITQVVTILGSSPSATIGAGSTSFLQFNPSEGTLTAVTFAFPHPAANNNPVPGGVVATVTFDYRGGSNGPLGGTIDREDYTLDDPTGVLSISSQVSNQFTVNGSTFQSINDAELGLANTSDPNLNQYIGNGTITLESFSARDNPADFVAIGAFCPFTCGTSPDAPQLSITYDFTPAATPLPAALPLFATGLCGLGLFGWRKKRKAQAVAA